jgi:hypothetical protein
MQVLSESYLVDFVSVTTPTGIYDLTSRFDTTLDTLNIIELPNVLSHLIELNVTSASTGNDYYIDIYQNNNFFNTIVGSGTGTYVLDFLSQTAGLNVSYQFKIRGASAMTLSTNIKYSVQFISSGLIVSEFTTCTNANSVILLNTDLSSMSPVMKVSDFFSGVLKVYNMTCYGNTVNNFQVEPLDDWYSAGAIVDISQFTDVDTIDVDKMKLYKKITMKYQDSESFLNKQFSQLFMREYGNTSYQYSYDGDEFTLDVPFENLLQTKFTGTNLQVGYSLNNEFAPYIPKPILLYQYDNKDVDFHFNNGTTTLNITNYTPFGQDLYTNLTDYTLNFAPDISTMLNVPVQQTLFGTYYFSYLYNLYNLKQRLISVKTILPIALLTGLRLNDRLVIRDKRYIINSMQSNLTTGEVNFQLILDFRPMVNFTQKPNVGIAGGNVNVPIDFVNDTYSALMTSSNPDVTITPSLIYASQLVVVAIPAGSSGTVYPVLVTYTLNSGITQTRTINILQQ